MKNNQIISVVIPCRNEKSYIDRCLQSLINCNYPKEYLQVMVCDGLSDDGTADIIKEYAARYPFIFYVENPYRITPRAMNLGLNFKPFDYAMIMGAHSEIDADYIDTCKSILDSDPQIGCVGGIIYNIYETPESESIGLAMSSPFGVGTAHFRTGLKEGFVDTVGTPLYKKEVLDKTGFFNENLVRNQDDELNYRVADAGYKIYLTKSTGFKYYVRASVKKMFKQYAQYGYWKVYVNRLHRTVTTIRQLVPAGFVLFLYTGLLLSLLVPFAWIFYLSVLGLYLLASFISAVKISRNNSGIGKIMFTFWVLHYSYGTGYLRGIWNFLILRSNPVARQAELSR